jgi:transcriptional regulator
MNMNRRAMLMSLAAAGAWIAGDASAQEATPRPDPTLYIPDAHRVEDRQLLHDFMESFPFVDVITATPTLRITHIPSVLDRGRGQFGTVLGHISAQNPQKQTFDGAHAATIVFRGPHGYISPRAYATQRSVVPTWNFAVVHVTGRPRAIADKARAHDLLATLIRQNERRVGSTAYDFASQPPEYIDRMMQGISPFEMEIEAIEGKFKLGQERNVADRRGVLEYLKGRPYQEQSLYELTRAFYQRPAK